MNCLDCMSLEQRITQLEKECLALRGIVEAALNEETSEDEDPSDDEDLDDFEGEQGALRPPASKHFKSLTDSKSK